MNKQQLEAAKKDGTVLALERTSYFGQGRDVPVPARGAVPVTVLTVEQSRGVYSSSPKKTVASVRHVPERQAEARQSDLHNGRYNIAKPVQVDDDGIVLYVRQRGEDEEERGIAKFEARDFLMTWDEYVALRGPYIERIEAEAREQEEAAAAIDSRYKKVERALGRIPVAAERGWTSRVIEEDGRSKRRRVPTVEIDLTSAERLATRLDEPAAVDAIAAFVAAVVADEPWKGLADMSKDEILAYAERALAVAT